MLINSISAQSKIPIRNPFADCAALNPFCAAVLSAFEPKIKFLGQQEPIIPAEKAKKPVNTPTALIFAHYLAALVIFFAIISARAQSGVTLTWDPVTNSTIAAIAFIKAQPAAPTPLSPTLATRLRRPLRIS